MVGRGGVGVLAACGSSGSWDRRSVCANIVYSPELPALAAEHSVASKIAASLRPW